MGNLDATTLAGLAAVALLAGCVDAIAGGGGLLTLPALLLAGLDPAQAIATNKVQGAIGTASATFVFAQKRLIDWRSAWGFALVAFAGSIAGALSVRFLSRAALDALIPAILIAVSLYFLLSRGLREEDAATRVSAFVFGLVAPGPIGFYDGLFGPGAGSFYMVAFVTLLGYGVVRATAHTKLLNLSSNFGSLLLYAATGSIVWPVGLVMAGMAFVGAQIGSRLAIKLGARLIRPLLVVISSLAALRLLWDPSNPWRHALAALF